MEEVAEEISNGVASSAAGTSAGETVALVVLFAVYGVLILAGVLVARRTDTWTGRATGGAISVGAIAAIVVGVLALVDTIGTTVGGVNLGLPLLIIGLAALGVIFWLWMLLDAATMEADGGNDKLTWTVIVVTTNLLGAALYYMVRRPQRRSEIGR